MGVIKPQACAYEAGLMDASVHDSLVIKPPAPIYNKLEETGILQQYLKKSTLWPAVYRKEEEE